jgi:hypothetical protein
MTAQAQTSSGEQKQSVTPGQLFGVPKFSTQRREVPDNQNGNLGATPTAGSQVTVQTSRLDQLDIVGGIKQYHQQNGTWTAGQGMTLHQSPFGVAASILACQYKLQAAYNTFNQTGPLASLIQGYRPMWGSRTPGQVLATVDPFAAQTPVTSGVEQDFHMDIPFAVKFDEYYDLTAQGDPRAKVFDAIVSPMYMAAQARVVTPTITLAPFMGAGNALSSPVTVATNDTTSAFTAGSEGIQVYRDAWWTANNAAGNPVQYPWLYTRDYFTQPTQGQNRVGILIQNTGVSVGQVLSLYGYVWDPAANSGFGQMVPFSSIETFELVTGGSLQNLSLSPQALKDRMFSRVPGLAGVGAWNQGAFVLDFALSEDGGYLSNAHAINTYLVNGVQLNITFKSGLAPSATSTVYLGVEALKLATS